MTALVSRLVHANEWRPIDVEELEPNALGVVRSTDNRSVAAGPGAGKTELLAQRASYLLQTGASPAPRRILAISFKRDAATNLAARVRLRCHRDHADRFDSLTFDAFAKSLVDRFGQALPDIWRPQANYEIMMRIPRMDDFLRSLGEPPSRVGGRSGVMSLNTRTFERDHLIGQPLLVCGRTEPTAADWAAEQFWQSALHGGRTTHLSFPMIGRLAELMLRLNPLVCEALKLTYSHLFLDEFQDTTQVQYDLVKTIFLGSSTVVTAVGDVKQQIMRWANAIDDPFDLLETDFEARYTPLFNNYRSSPELVGVQHILARALDESAAEPVSKAKGTIEGDVCAIWDVSSPEVEAAQIANHVADSIVENGLAPRDFVLLVRQKAVDYAETLEGAFAERGLQIRNEADAGIVTLQDLLTEEASLALVRILRVASSDRAGALWSECQQALSLLRGVDPANDAAQVRLSQELDCFINQLRNSYPQPVRKEDHVRAVVTAVYDFLDRDRLVSAHPTYRQGDWFERVIEGATVHLCASAADADDWTEALDIYEGKHAVPLMTIHKSKGLEYHTVIFIGLDDEAWWSFPNDPAEGTAGFFVAFSRARQRVVFTYCRSRGRSREKIALLYELLKSAGIESVDLG